MPDWVWGVGIAAAVQGAVLAARALLRRRRGSRLTDGAAVSLRLVLTGAAAPYPRTPTRGRLLVGSEVLRFGTTSGSAVDLTACGLEVLRVRDARLDEGTDDDDSVTLACRDGLGTPVTLTADPGTADELAAVLRRRPRPDVPGPATASHGRPPLVLPLGLVAAGTVLALVTAVLLAGSTRVTGTVTSVDADEFCRVSWTDPRSGLARSNGVDCVEDVGEPSVVVALGPPLVGQVVDTDTPWFWFGAAGVLVLAGVGLAGRRALVGRRDPADAPSTVPPRRRRDELVRLTRDDVGWAALAEASRARAAAEGWLVTDAGATRRARRRLLKGVAASAFVPVIAVVLALTLEWTSFAGVLARTGPTARAVAATGETIDGLPLLAPQDLEVRFTTADGRRVETLVAVGGLPDPTPSTIEVDYSVDDPERAVAVGYGADVRGAVVGAVILLGAPGGLAWWLSPLLLSGRRQRRAVTGGPRTRVRYAAFLADSGDAVLVLAGDLPGTGGRPERTVVLDPGAQALLPAATGDATLHGAPHPGSTVALTVEVAGVETLVPLASPLLEDDEEGLLLLVNGEDGEDDEPGPPTR